MKNLHPGIVLLAAILIVVAVEGQLRTVHEWNYIDYVWPSESVRSKAIKDGAYNLTQIIPMDVDVAPDGRVFISMYNLGGVPARLGYVTKYAGSSGPLIQPYPNWGWTNDTNCNSIIEVIRIAIDECNRLWVLDTGSVNDQRRCDSKLLAFDLSTDELIEKVIIPRNISTNLRTNQSLLANVIVETSVENCEDRTVYMGDAEGNGLVVWDGVSLYRMKSSSFNPESDATNVSIGSDNADFKVGIVGMDLSPRVFLNEPRLLYFRPLASFGLFAFYTEQLKRSIAYGRPCDIFGSKNVLSSQSIGQAFSSEGTLFLGLTKETAIACWNRYRGLIRDNIEIVAQDSERLQYADGIKVIPPGNFNSEEELWVITNRYMRTFIKGRLNQTEINFRILKSSVRSLIAGTKCEIPFDISYSIPPRHPTLKWLLA